jgi:hypothetical protein
MAALNTPPFFLPYHTEKPFICHISITLKLILFVLCKFYILEI